MTQRSGAITEGEDLLLPGSWSGRMAEGRQGRPMRFDGAKARPPAPRAQEAGLCLGNQRRYNRSGDHSGSSAKHKHSHYRRGAIRNVVLTPSLALGRLLSELQQRLAGPRVCSRCLFGLSAPGTAARLSGVRVAGQPPASRPADEHRPRGVGTRCTSIWTAALTLPSQGPAVI